MSRQRKRRSQNTLSLPTLLIIGGTAIFLIAMIVLALTRGGGGNQVAQTRISPSRRWNGSRLQTRIMPSRTRKQSS